MCNIFSCKKASQKKKSLKAKSEGETLNSHFLWRWTSDNSIEVNCHSIIASQIVLKKHRAKSSLGTSQQIIAHFAHLIDANGMYKN